MLGTSASGRFFFFGGGLLALLAMELLAPYRPSSVPKAKRWANNLGLTAFNTVVLYGLFGGAAMKTAVHVTSGQGGVMNLVALPLWVEIALALIFLDFMLYIWHLLNHVIPFFWRFHRVHHSDPNMDVSTATRFHVGELAISAVIKIGLIFFLGAPIQAVVAFEILVVLCAQFHHSSLKVPQWFERVFWVLFVPPSMHRIHHSVIIKERDSNYGTIFSFWDRFMGTLVAAVDQKGIRIGVGAYSKAERLGLLQLLAMPFTRPVR